MSNLKPYVINPIGVIRSAITERAAAPRQGAEGGATATIELLPEMLPALHRLEPGREIIVITWFHAAKRDVLEVYPRSDPNLPLTGVFCTRSPDRPNPLGLHRVTLIAIDGHELRVAPLEAIDGTPVVDIKPVLSSSADF